METRHLPTEATIQGWPDFTFVRPLRVLASGCLAGRPCGVDGSTYGESPTAASLFALPNVRVFDFCPEDFAFGTPRATPDIHGGDGHDVLDGRARIRTDDGQDWTEDMVRAPTGCSSSRDGTTCTSRCSWMSARRAALR